MEPKRRNSGDETNLPTNKMATDETPNVAAGSASAAPNHKPTNESSDKANGNRGDRGDRGSRGGRGGRGGGRDRGNDKDQKRKHSGFGSAKYATASTFFDLVASGCRH